MEISFRFCLVPWENKVPKLQFLAKSVYKFFSVHWGLGMFHFLEASSTSRSWQHVCNSVSCTKMANFRGSRWEGWRGSQQGHKELHQDLRWQCWEQQAALDNPWACCSRWIHWCPLCICMMFSTLLVSLQIWATLTLLLWYAAHHVLCNFLVFLLHWIASKLLCVFPAYPGCLWHRINPWHIWFGGGKGARLSWEGSAWPCTGWDGFGYNSSWSPKEARNDKGWLVQYQCWNCAHIDWRCCKALSTCNRQYNQQPCEFHCAHCCWGAEDRRCIWPQTSVWCYYSWCCSSEHICGKPHMPASLPPLPILVVSWILHLQDSFWFHLQNHQWFWQMTYSMW